MTDFTEGSLLLGTGIILAGSVFGFWWTRRKISELSRPVWVMWFALLYCGALLMQPQALEEHMVTVPADFAPIIFLIYALLTTASTLLWWWFYIFINWFARKYLPEPKPTPKYEHDRTAVG